LQQSDVTQSVLHPKTFIIHNSVIGSGSTTTRLTIPISWIKEMGINEDSREVEVTFEDNKITIQKKSLD